MEEFLIFYIFCTTFACVYLWRKVATLYEYIQDVSVKSWRNKADLENNREIHNERLIAIEDKLGIEEYDQEKYLGQTKYISVLLKRILAKRKGNDFETKIPYKCKACGCEDLTIAKQELKTVKVTQYMCNDCHKFWINF